MAASPYFDRVLVDDRPAWWDLPAVFRLRRSLAEGGYQRVYDLQTSGRSSRYFRLFPRGARPEWSGIAPGCSHPDRDPNRDHMHDIDRQRGQLRQAGITDIPPADLSWSHGDLTRFALPPRLALLVPGSSPHRPQKRWPVRHYRDLALALAERGLTPVVIGAAGERDLAAEICRDTPARDLTGRPASATSRNSAASPNSRWATTPARSTCWRSPASRRWCCSPATRTRPAAPRAAAGCARCNGRTSTDLTLPAVLDALPQPAGAPA